MKGFAHTFRHIVCLAAFVGAVTYATEAKAALVTVDSVGDSFTVDFDGNVAGQNLPGLTAEAVFTVTSFTSSSIAFKVDLTNTTSDPLDSRVSSLGFDTTPDITGASASGIFNFAVLGSSYPNGFGSIEACFNDAQANTCNGGGGGGVNKGGTGTFNIVLDFNGPITQFSFDKFGVRYQSITGTTLGTSGTGTGTVNTDPTPAPEPTTMVLLGTGLVGAALARRRARQQ
jgi:hypothetical protein